MTSTADQLDLIFSSDSSSGDVFRVRWESPLLGVRESRFALPYQGVELMRIARALDLIQDPAYPFATTEAQRQRFHIQDLDREALARVGLWDARAPGRVRADAPQVVGMKLREALTDDPAGLRALTSARDQASAHGLPLSIRLRLPPQAVELAALPWELLWGDAPTPLIVRTGRMGALVRHLDVADPLPEARTDSAPLQLLAIVPHMDTTAELRSREQTGRMRALQPLIDTGALTLQTVSPATRSELLDEVQARPPDLIYYYGHGDFRAGGGTLRLDDGPCAIPALLVLFGGARMVMLFACEGGRVDPEGSLFSGIAPALSAEGVPIVLGMQASLRVEAGLRAASKILSSLAEQHSVQASVSRARQALFVEEQERASWFVPALYIRSTERGPVYLRSPRAPLQPPAPIPQPQGTSQVIRATGHAQVRNVRQEGEAGADQRVDATGGATVDHVTQRGGAGDRQAIEAADAEIRDVEQHGVRTQPAISPERQQEHAALRERLKIHRETLAHWLKQQAIFGSAYAPPAVAHGIREARAELQRVKEALANMGMRAEDYPDDTA